MRLIECYIENFGIYREYSCKFDTGLNCFLSENGSGKTTLSVFICSMLYGMPETRKQNLSENERKKYAPWQGGKYGGSLTLETGGVRYTIERSFGSKPSDDTFVLRDTLRGTESSDYSEKIGEELFGIDRDGFMRTVFLSEKNLSVSNDNKTISAKLSDLVGVDGDVGGFDDAISLLDERRKFYYKKSGNCEIATVKASLSERRLELDAIKARESEREERANRLSELTKKKSVLEEEKKALSCKLLESTERNIRRMNAERYKELEEKLRGYEGRLTELEAFFAGRIPTLGEIDEIRFSLIECERIEKEERATEQKEEGADERYASLTFEAIASAERALLELEGAERELSVLKSESSAHIEDSRKTGRGIPASVPLTLGALLTLLGIALGAGVGAAFYLISALGAVLLFSGIGIARARRDESDEKEIHDTEKAELKALTERTEELRSMLESFTRKLGEPGENLSCELTKIKAEYTRYYTVSTARRSEDIGREKRLETARIMRKRAEEFISRYPLDAPDPLLRLSELLTEYSFTRIETEKAREECKKYKERYDVKEAADETPICDDGDLSGEISRREAELSEISVELARLKSACEKDLTERERAWELEGEITALEEKLTEYTETLSVIQSTMSLLAEACDNMTSRYIGKTKESFLRYEEALGGNGGSFAVDTDFALSKSEHGAARSEESYSRGTRDLYSLAMRLGLVDSLYESEQPFIILDDPFISLDDERLKKGKKLLAELAKKRQILYFTCANSRKI